MSYRFVPSRTSLRVKQSEADDLTEAEAIRQTQKADGAALERTFRFPTQQVCVLHRRTVRNTSEAEDWQRMSDIINPRHEQACTPEERLGAVARVLVMHMIRPVPNVPDYADFTDTLRLFVRRELLLARMNEARSFGNFARELDLQKQLDDVSFEIGHWIGFHQ
jgi:hypothetical protein